MSNVEIKHAPQTAWMLGAVAACTALPAGAAIIRVDGLNQDILGNTPFALDVDGNGSADINFSNLISYAGSNYWGTPYYNRSVSIAGANAGATVSGSQAAPGTLIGPATPMSASATLDSTTASFSTAVVSYGYYSSCGKYGCSYYSYPIYGTVGSYAVNDANIGNNLLFGFGFTDGHGQTDYGWLDLTISDPGTQTPYAFRLNGYGYDNRGLAVAAGAQAVADAPVAPSNVPEPGGLSLLAIGAIGLARYRRKTH